VKPACTFAARITDACSLGPVPFLPFAFSIFSRMCGRFTHLFTWKELHRLMGLVTIPEPELAPRYNVAPMQNAPVIRAKGGERTGAMLRWGLVPSWAEDPAIGNRLINARRETIAEKPAFRAAAASRRGLVPVSGFYEWRTDGKHKTPFWIGRADRQPFMLAALWERWAKSDPALETFTLITTEPNALMSPIHSRMPVIVEPHAWDLWLDPRVVVFPRDVCEPRDWAGFETRRISSKVNNPRNDDPSVLDGAEPETLW